MAPLILLAPLILHGIFDSVSKWFAALVRWIAETYPWHYGYVDETQPPEVL